MAISKVTSDAIDATGFNLDSDTLTIDATNNRVGIGTASPSAPLTVSKSSGYTEATVASGSQEIDLFTNDTGSTCGLLTSSNISMVFHTNNTERMRIDSSGNVGIGTSSPASTFHTKVGTDENFRMVSDSGVRFQAMNDAGSTINTMKIGGDPLIFLGTGGTERLRIDSFGNLNNRGATFGVVSNPQQPTITLANNAATNIAVSGTGAAGGGILCIYEPASGENAVYHVGYNRGNLISNSNGSLYATGTTSGKNTIQVSGHQITFTNRTGTSRGYTFNLFLAGGNAYNQ